MIDVLDRVPGLSSRYAGLRQEMQDARLEARMHAYEYGEDIDEVQDWVWSDSGDTGKSKGGPQTTGGDND